MSEKLRHSLIFFYKYFESSILGVFKGLACYFWLLMVEFDGNKKICGKFFGLLICGGRIIMLGK
jgi:hypothetical protein